MSYTLFSNAAAAAYPPASPPVHPPDCLLNNAKNHPQKNSLPLCSTAAAAVAVAVVVEAAAAAAALFSNLFKPSSFTAFLTRTATISCSAAKNIGIMPPHKNEKYRPHGLLSSLIHYMAKHRKYKIVMYTIKI